MAAFDFEPLNKAIDEVDGIIQKLGQDGKTSLDAYLSSISADAGTRVQWYLEMIDLLLTQLSRTPHNSHCLFITVVIVRLNAEDVGDNVVQALQRERDRLLRYRDKLKPRSEPTLRVDKAAARRHIMHNIRVPKSEQSSPLQKK